MSMYNFNEEEITRGQVNSQGGYRSPQTNPYAMFGGMSKYLGQFGKAYDKYSPYLNLLGARSGKDLVEGGLDLAARSFIPGYSQIKMFNDITGGINLNKMLGIKNPLSALSRGIFGGGRGGGSSQNNAYLAAAGRYQKQLEGQRNAMAEQERSAMAQRAELQPQLVNARERALEMMLQGPSSRDLAPILGAAESRNRTVGAAGEAALQQRFANSGVGGGISAGLAQQQLAAQQGRSANIANQVALQQLSTRPQMAANAANMLQNADYMAMQEQQTGRANALAADQMQMAQANQQREYELAEQRQSAANRQAEMAQAGALLRMAYPDLKKGYDKAIGYGRTNTPDTRSVDIAGQIAADESSVGTDFSNRFAGAAFLQQRDRDLQAQIAEDSAGLEAGLTGQYIRPGTSFPTFNMGSSISAPQALVDDELIGRVRAEGGRYVEELGGGLAMVAYQDPSTGRFMKMYARSQKPVSPTNANNLGLDFSRQERGTTLDDLSLTNLMR